MRIDTDNPAASVDAPTRVCLQWLRQGRRATEQRRWATVRTVRASFKLVLLLVSVFWLSGCIIYPHYEEHSPAVQGRILDAQSRQPVAGARVAFSNKHSLSAKTDSNGSYSIKATKRLEPLLGVGICGPECSIWRDHWPEALDITRRGFEPLRIKIQELWLPHNGYEEGTVIQLRDVFLEPESR